MKDIGAFTPSDFIDDVGGFIGSDQIIGKYGYGSGVFEQVGQDKDVIPQKDVMVVYEGDPVKFYEHLFKKFPNDFLNGRLLKWDHQTRVQKHVEAEQKGGKMFFVPYVKVKDRNGVEHTTKIGFISKENAIKDLLEWDTLIFAGRNHNETCDVVNDQDLEHAKVENWRSGARAALLLLTDQFTEDELFYTICGLSYIGDKRIERGLEHPDKIKNIVRGSFNGFRENYKDIISDLLFQGVISDLGTGKMQRNTEAEVQRDLLSNLPVNLKKKITGGGTLEKINTLTPEEVSKVIFSGIQEIVAPAASGQTRKGILMQSIYKSVQYGLDKRKKQKGKPEDPLKDPYSSFFSYLAASAADLAKDENILEHCTVPRALSTIMRVLPQSAIHSVPNISFQSQGKKDPYIEFMKMVQDKSVV